MFSNALLTPSTEMWRQLNGWAQNRLHKRPPFVKKKFLLSTKSSMLLLALYSVPIRRIQSHLELPTAEWSSTIMTLEATVEKLHIWSLFSNFSCNYWCLSFYWTLWCAIRRPPFTKAGLKNVSFFSTGRQNWLIWQMDKWCNVHPPPQD